MTDPIKNIETALENIDLNDLVLAFSLLSGKAEELLESQLKYAKNPEYGDPREAYGLESAMVRVIDKIETATEELRTYI